MASKIWINNDTGQTIQAGATLGATSYSPLETGKGNNSFDLPDGSTYYVYVGYINDQIYVSVQTQAT